MARIAACTKPNCRSLEVGPGSGLYLPALALVSDNVVASDIDDEYLSRAREIAQSLGTVQCVNDDITLSKFENLSFDFILCTEVVEHIADSNLALLELSRLLSVDGVLLLTTPQKFSPLELCAKIAFLPGVIQLVRLIYREPIVPTGHINLLTEKALKEQLAQAGLSISEEYKCGMYLPLVAEFGGTRGRRFLGWLESKLRGTFCDGLLWTQCYVLRRSQGV
ncbi:MAG: class I SAM-dependent methyltransferase [Halioglobus sp.]